METVGQRIKRLRKERKWTQEMLGAKLGVKKAAVQKYESGRVVNLKQETIKKLTDLFEVPSSTFLDCSDWDNYAEKVNLSEQVTTIQLIQKHFGNDAVALLHVFSELNAEGKKKLISEAEKLREIHVESEVLN